MARRRTISLFLYIPETREVVLSVRAEGQSWSGLLQATCHGTLKKKETHDDALERELAEETTLDLIKVKSPRFIGELEAGVKKKESCSYYLAEIIAKDFQKIKATQEVRGFIKVTKKDFQNILPLSEAAASKGDIKKQRTMFDDEREALGMVFDLI